MKYLFIWFILVAFSAVAVPSGQAQVGSRWLDYSLDTYHPAECSVVLMACRTRLSYRSNALTSRGSVVSSVSGNEVQDETERVHTGWLVAGGVAGGLAGVGLGALATTTCSDDDWCSGPIFLGVGAEILGVPWGVHVANGGKGNYLLEALASAAVFAFGVTALQSNDSVLDGEGRALLLLIPAAQIGVSIALERRWE